MEEVGSLFSSFLISLGTKMLLVATKLTSKAAPALASGALSALGSLRIDKIFGKGITVPKKHIPALVAYEKEFTTKRINNKTYQTTGKLEFKPTQKHIQGGLLGTLASIGIPKAMSLGKLKQLIQGAGVLHTVTSTGFDLFVNHGLPWMGKKLLKWVDIIQVKQ